MDDYIYTGSIHDITEAAFSPTARLETTLGSMVISKIHLDNNVDQLMPGLIECDIELHKKNKLYGCRLFKIDEGQYGLKIAYVHNIH